jgi:hypothetical protein
MNLKDIAVLGVAGVVVATQTAAQKAIALDVPLAAVTIVTSASSSSYGVLNTITDEFFRTPIPERATAQST